MNFKHICALATLIFITLETSCAAKKKEIFIPAPTKEYMSQVPYWGPEAEAIKYHAKQIAQNKLIELYAKEHPLQTTQYQKELQKALESCDRTDERMTPGLIAGHMASERVEKLSQKEIQDFYEKIKADPKSYPAGTSHFVDEGFPPFSESLIDQIKIILWSTWEEQQRNELRKQPIATLKSSPIYTNYIKNCKAEHTLSFIPSAIAFNDLMLKQAKQLVNTMSNGQVKEYYEKHPDVAIPSGQPVPFSMDNIAQIRQGLPYQMLDDVYRKALRPIAQSYTFKSKSPEVLAFIEDLKAGK